MGQIKVFGVSFFLFLVLDFIWFSYVVRDFNLKHLQEIGRIKDGQFDILYLPALGVYVFMSLAVTLFLTSKIKLEDPAWMVFLQGAVLGLIIYGVFDLTNLAVLKNYPILFAIVDMTWGFFVFGVVSVLLRVLKLI